MIVTEVLPWSLAAENGAQPGVVVTLDSRRLLFTADAPPGPDERAPTVDELASLAFAGPYDSLEVAPPEVLTAPIKQWSVTYVSVDSAYLMQSAVVPFALAVVFTFGLLWLRIVGAVPSLTPWPSRSPPGAAYRCSPCRCSDRSAVGDARSSPPAARHAAARPALGRLPDRGDCHAAGCSPARLPHAPRAGS